jgi:hypothetical protein
MSKAQQLQEKAATLPEQLAAEVLDFLEFIAAKRAREQAAPTAPITPRVLPTFKGGRILADPREIKRLVYDNHE